MNLRSKFFSLCAVLIILGATTQAQVADTLFGKNDTLYVDMTEIKSGQWSLGISYSNKNAITAISVPLKYNAGLAKLIADSAVYAGGRVETWAFKGFRCDTAIQVITLGMIANLGPSSKNVLNAGSGRLVTVFLHAADSLKPGPLVVDTCTSYPNNTLQTVGDFSNLNLKEGEKITAEMVTKLTIAPAFMVRKEK